MRILLLFAGDAAYVPAKSKINWKFAEKLPAVPNTVPSFSMSAASFRKSSSSIPSGRRLSLEGLAGQEVQLTPNDVTFPPRSHT